ncbi:hypothetical protein NPS53_08275 [Pseudomonas putida]|uniref:hypothetical protein n=1 Tax=Pseudomonas putida TaxID=303 RepID=UPI002364A70F|nr:hypothetical protein [Pseudomonas putida]MDD2139567.1 hypothetical protein [Pseudomonas putida]HDS1721490.1 hypothetical protein [Pseudomonas putida]
MFLIGGLVFLAFVFLVWKIMAPAQIYSRFGVSAATHKLLSTDLGKGTGRIKLALHGINGIPDAVFEAKASAHILVGEFKSRKYRNRVKAYELYQIMLYMGHLRDKYPKHKVTGCLAYADGKVSVQFDSELYAALIALKGEFWETLKNRRPVNPTPLHKRIRVNGANPGLRLSAEL